VVPRVRHWAPGRSCLHRWAARAAVGGHAVRCARGNGNEHERANTNHRAAHGATVSSQRHSDAYPHATGVHGDTDAAGDDNARAESGAPNGNTIDNCNTVDNDNASGDGNVTSDGNTRTDGDAPFGHHPAATNDGCGIRIPFASAINADPASDDDDDDDRGNEHADGHTNPIGDPDEQPHADE